MKKDLLNSELHMMKKTFCMLFFAAAMPAAFAHRPTDVSLGGEWLFHRGEVAGGEAVFYQNGTWAYDDVKGLGDDSPLSARCGELPC